MSALVVFIGLILGWGARPAEAVLVDVAASQDAEVASGTQWPDATQTNQGTHPELEPIRANDGFDTRRRVYFQFDLLADPTLANALAQGDRITAYTLHAFNLRNFVLGDAVIGDVITRLHYVADDVWAEGPYADWTVLPSPNPQDGLTWDNQVGINEFLAEENEDAAEVWYRWGFSPDAFAVGGPSDDPNLLSLALVPNELESTNAWWLVTSFAAREYADSSKPPFLRVEIRPIPEPSSAVFLGFGLLGLTGWRRWRRF